MKIEVYDPITLIVVWEKDYEAQNKKETIARAAHDFHEETNYSPGNFNVRVK